MDDDLLIRFILEECSIEEKRQVLRLVESDEKYRRYLNELQSVWASVQIDRAMQKEKVDRKQVRLIMKKIRKKQPNRIQLSFSIACGIAAAICLFLFLPFTKKDKIDYEKIVSGITNQKEITLTVGGDEQIKLMDSSAVISYTNKGQVLINDTLAVQEEVAAELNTIHVPYGKRSILILSDGSKIHLNSGTYLVYPSAFSSRQREVYLEGEAYFEVMKDPNRKFIVKTVYKSVEVVGTQFNIWVDKTTNRFETVLVSGKVNLDGNTGKIELVPSQLYTYSNTTGEENLQMVDVNYYTSWINGVMRFNREPLSKILYKLEKVYNIKIKLLKSEYKNHLISGSLDLRNSADETLDVVMHILVSHYDPQRQTFYQIEKK
ncbi:FecR family protein [Parabacteroides sp. Marseille-P3160]|uniref:FecR family protein n=1 Tax=Parabacteroides sp. Marseille-P3160 TaxID=1917887 RepID=UPI0009BC56EE|nr:FecR family protein [Parabacteroides sp. Marseille-P3160]